MNERGFSLLETIVVVAIAGTIAIATALFVQHPPRLRAVALGLQGAFAETRALAAANAVANATGATLTVETLAGRNATRVSVLRGRPIDGAPPLERGDGASVVLPGIVAVDSAAGTFAAPFAVLVSSSGYASIANGYTFDPGRPRTLATDPGCPAGGVTISIVDGASHDAHPFACRGARYDADATAPPARP